MADKSAAPRILFPRTIIQALEFYGSEPEAIFWAGGTGFSRSETREGDKVNLPKVVIALTLVEELARASRTENSLEIGAMMSLDRLASIGRHALPPGLPEVLGNIGTRPLRCRATIGGNIASGGDLLPLMKLLDAKVEIRYLRERKGRRKPVQTIKRIPLVILQEDSVLHRGDLVTRISIPTETWNFAYTEKLPPVGGESQGLCFQAVARVEKSTLVDWRMSFRSGGSEILRDRDIETALAGSPLPLSRRGLEMLDESVTHVTRSWNEGSIDRETAICLARTFMKRAAG